MAKLETQEKEMTLEESKSWRASKYVAPTIILTEEQKREEFRIFWAANKAKFGETKSNIEKALWIHLKSIGMDTPEQFLLGMTNFGLKQVK